MVVRMILGLFSDRHSIAVPAHWRRIGFASVARSPFVPSALLLKTISVTKTAMKSSVSLTTRTREKYTQRMCLQKCASCVNAAREEWYHEFLDGRTCCPTCRAGMDSDFVAGNCKWSFLRTYCQYIDEE